MATPEAFARALRSQHRAFRALAKGIGNATKITLRLGDEESRPLKAATVVGELAFDYDERGGVRKRLPFSATISVALLPSWATADALPRKGRAVIGEREYKIDSAEINAAYLYITGFHWATS